jgi:hypothetical protein
LICLARMSSERKYFCDEPWTGVLSVSSDLDVVFCPCYLKMKIGSLSTDTLLNLWNREKLIDLRKSFARGELPAVCRPQLCPVAVGTEKYTLADRLPRSS